MTSRKLLPIIKSGLRLCPARENLNGVSNPYPFTRITFGHRLRSLTRRLSDTPTSLFSGRSPSPYTVDRSPSGVETGPKQLMYCFSPVTETSDQDPGLKEDLHFKDLTVQRFLDPPVSTWTPRYMVMVHERTIFFERPLSLLPRDSVLPSLNETTTGPRPDSERLTHRETSGPVSGGSRSVKVGNQEEHRKVSFGFCGYLHFTVSVSGGPRSSDNSTHTSQTLTWDSPLRETMEGSVEERPRQ